MRFLLHPPSTSAMQTCSLKFAMIAPLYMDLFLHAGVILNFLSSEFLPLGNEDNTWCCQCRDLSWCLTISQKCLNYIPISREYEMSYRFFYKRKGRILHVFLWEEMRLLMPHLLDNLHLFFFWSNQAPSPSSVVASGQKN